MRAWYLSCDLWSWMKSPLLQHCPEKQREEHGQHGVTHTLHTLHTTHTHTHTERETYCSRPIRTFLELRISYTISPLKADGSSRKWKKPLIQPSFHYSSRISFAPLWGIGGGGGVIRETQQGRAEIWWDGRSRWGSEFIWASQCSWLSAVDQPKLKVLHVCGYQLSHHPFNYGYNQMLQ